MERWKARCPKHEEELDTDTVCFAKDDVHCICDSTAKAAYMMRDGNT
jgi:hypothetical protein